MTVAKDVRIKCKNANKAQGLTKGKFYAVIDHNPEYFCIYNDNGIAGYYKRTRFVMIV